MSRQHTHNSVRAALEEKKTLFYSQDAAIKAALVHEKLNLRAAVRICLNSANVTVDHYRTLELAFIQVYIKLIKKYYKVLENQLGLDFKKNNIVSNVKVLLSHMSSCQSIPAHDLVVREDVELQKNLYDIYLNEISRKENDSETILELAAQKVNESVIQLALIYGALPIYSSNESVVGYPAAILADNDKMEHTREYRIAMSALLDAMGRQTPTYDSIGTYPTNAKIEHLRKTLFASSRLYIQSNVTEDDIIKLVTSGQKGRENPKAVLGRHSVAIGDMSPIQIIGCYLSEKKFCNYFFTRVLVKATQHDKHDVLMLLKEFVRVRGFNKSSFIGMKSIHFFLPEADNYQSRPAISRPVVNTYLAILTTLGLCKKSMADNESLILSMEAAVSCVYIKGMVAGLKSDPSAENKPKLMDSLKESWAQLKGAEVTTALYEKYGMLKELEDYGEPKDLLKHNTHDVTIAALDEYLMTSGVLKRIEIEYRESLRCQQNPTALDEVNDKVNFDDKAISFLVDRLQYLQLLKFMDKNKDRLVNRDGRPFDIDIEYYKKHRRFKEGDLDALVVRYDTQGVGAETTLLVELASEEGCWYAVSELLRLDTCVWPHKSRRSAKKSLLDKASAFKQKLEAIPSQETSLLCFHVLCEEIICKGNLENFTYRALHGTHESTALTDSQLVQKMVECFQGYLGPLSKSKNLYQATNGPKNPVAESSRVLNYAKWLGSKLKQNDDAYMDLYYMLKTLNVQVTVSGVPTVFHLDMNDTVSTLLAAIRKHLWHDLDVSRVGVMRNGDALNSHDQLFLRGSPQLGGYYSFNIKIDLDTGNQVMNDSDYIVSQAKMFGLYAGGKELTKPTQRCPFTTPEFLRLLVSTKGSGQRPALKLLVRVSINDHIRTFTYKQGVNPTAYSFLISLQSKAKNLKAYDFSRVTLVRESGVAYRQGEHLVPLGSSGEITVNLRPLTLNKASGDHYNATDSKAHTYSSGGPGVFAPPPVAAEASKPKKPPAVFCQARPQMPM
jgi:hypothetical protein